MFIPSAKSNLSLLILMIAAIALFIWVDGSRTFVSDQYYKEKLEAAKLMQETERAIKEYRLSQDIYIDEVNDPNRTALIGEKQSLIVTDRGDLTAKLSSLNPNFAAAMIEMFKEANLHEGDKIALSCTGSFPALNIAVLSAAKILKLDVVMISSVGASMFGATDTDFTWLDMEKFFNDRGIFPYKSVAASIGGGRDLGRGLTKMGRDFIVENIRKHDIELVQTSSLEENIIRKMQIFEENGDDNIGLYVNIGGGLSSLGISLNGQLIKPGLHRYLTLTNTPLKGTMLLFADKGIPVMHLLNIPELIQNLQMPLAPDPLPEPGEGSLFEDEKYSITVTVISSIVLLILILVIIFFDQHKLKLKEDEINV